MYVCSEALTLSHQQTERLWMWCSLQTTAPSDTTECVGCLPRLRTVEPQQEKIKTAFLSTDNHVVKYRDRWWSACRVVLLTELRFIFDCDKWSTSGEQSHITIGEEDAKSENWLAGGGRPCSWRRTSYNPQVLILALSTATDDALQQAYIVSSSDFIVTSSPNLYPASTTVVCNEARLQILQQLYHTWNVLKLISRFEVVQM